MIKKRCECYRKILKLIFSQTRYCSACALYTKELRRKVNYYRRHYRKLNKILYGQKRGNERVR